MTWIFLKKEVLDLIRSWLRASRKLRTQQENYCTILLPVTYVNIMFDNRSTSTNQICLRLALSSPLNHFGAQEHGGEQ